MKISITGFSGISPKTPARYLGNEQAQVAINCPIFSGSIQSLPDPGNSVFSLPKAGVPKTIYRFGMDIPSDTDYWFHWTNDVDVVKGPIAGDTSERTYYTGDGAPKVTNATLGLSASPGSSSKQFPLSNYLLGIPAPTQAITVATTGTPDVGATPESRSYIYTWVSADGEESAPSPASSILSVSAGQSVNIYGFDTIPYGAYNIATCRIYRATDGAFLFVSEITVAATVAAVIGAPLNDALSADGLGEVCPSITWTVPPVSLTGLIGLPNGIMAGFSGRDVYMCDPYHPFAWPQGYINTVDYPVVGLGRMDTTLAVLTKGTPYFIQGTHPDSMAVVKSDLEQACASKRSIVSAMGAVIYASPDGLVSLSPNGSKLLTESMFSRAQWQAAYKPESIHAYQHDNKYIAFYDTGAVQGGFIYDLQTGQFVNHSIYATCAYNDLVNDTLYLAFSDRTVKKWISGSAMSYTWKSKKFSFPYDVSFSCAKLEAEAYPVTAIISANGSTLHTQTVTSRNPFRLPIKLALDWEVQIQGTAEVFSFVMAQAMSELSNG